MKTCIFFTIIKFHEKTKADLTACVSELTGSSSRFSVSLISSSLRMSQFLSHVILLNEESELLIFCKTGQDDNRTVKM